LHVPFCVLANVTQNNLNKFSPDKSFVATQIYQLNFFFVMAEKSIVQYWRLAAARKIFVPPKTPVSALFILEFRNDKEALPASSLTTGVRNANKSLIW
jgi:hypothetical protein